MAETTNMGLVNWLDDLTVRFLLNLPPTELSSVPRLCFQVEEAQWFYEDFIRPLAASNNTPLPALPLRQFMLLLFQHCPLLNNFTSDQHLQAYEEFLAYKVRVPVRGAIMLDERMEKVVLVKGWKKGASWSFPRGKINKDERDLDCAIREVDEETGFDLRAAGLAGLNPGEAAAKYIDVTMKEQQLRMFVFRGVPTDTPFAPKTRKEISKIAWYNVRDLPGFTKKNKSHGPGAETEAGQSSKFYMVAPFLGQLKKWIAQQRRQDAATMQSIGQEAVETEGYDTTDAIGEVTPEQPSVPIPPDRSEELKRLLSIGGLGASALMDPSPLSQQQPTHSGQPPTASANLLAMLQGGPPATAMPQTPLDQINAFPQQPRSPMPHHPREPSVGGYQQAPPHFPFSPPRLPPQQHLWQARDPSAPAPGIFGQNESFRYDAFQQQQHQQQGMAFGGPPLGRTQQSMHEHFHPMQMQQHQQHQHQQTLHDTHQHFPVNPAQAAHAFLPQVLQGQGQAIASGPEAPKASQLPPPKLNQHSMKLLDAFKSGGKSEPGALDPSQGGPRQGALPGTSQQNALLNLFKLPSQQRQAEGQDAKTATGAVSLTPTDMTGRPRPTERRPTLSEITRTLPPKRKSSSSSHVTAVNAARTSDQNDGVQTSTVQAVAPHIPPVQEDTRPQIQILQRPPFGGKAPVAASQLDPRSTMPSAKTRPLPSPKLQNGRSDIAIKSAESNAIRPASLTVLQRPNSRKGTKSPVPLKSASPLRHESPKPPQPFQPQVLKRPQPGEAAQAVSSTSISDEVGPKAPSNGADKTNQLLALFGKAPMSPQAVPEQPSALLQRSTAPREFDKVQSETEQEANILALMGKAPISPADDGLSQPPYAQTPNFLERSKPVLSSQPAARVASPTNPSNKTSHLLSLLSRSPAPVTTPQFTPTPLPPASTAHAQQHSLQREASPLESAKTNHLLNLLTSTGASAALTNIAQTLPDTATLQPPPQPPSAPRLSPAVKPARQTPSPRRPGDQTQQLLGLFTQKAAQKGSTASALTSPGTPISPFALPTPAQQAAAAAAAAQNGLRYDFAPDSRKGSIHSNGGRNSGVNTPTPMPVPGGSSVTVAQQSAGGLADGSGTGKGRSSVSTPSEHKDFLLGYLAGVVKNEGAKGAGR